VECRQAAGVGVVIRSFAMYQRRADVAPLAMLLAAASRYQTRHGLAARKRKLVELTGCESETAVPSEKRSAVIERLDAE
jgi:hypothetical protein